MAHTLTPTRSRKRIQDESEPHTPSPSPTKQARVYGQPFSPSPIKRLEFAPQYRHWILSHDVSHSAAHDRKGFERYTHYDSYVYINRKLYEIKGYGTVEVKTFSSWDDDPLQKRTVILSNVLHIPALPYNVLSVNYCLRDPRYSLSLTDTQGHFCTKTPFNTSTGKQSDTDQLWDKPSVCLSKQNVSFVGAYAIYARNDYQLGCSMEQV